MALYHGVAGLARMFGCPIEHITEDLRKKFQAKIDELKDERSSSPFGVFADDIKELRSYEDQFLKKDSVRCKSLRQLIKFLEKKSDGHVAGLNRIADDNGRAIWTSLDTAQAVKDAIKRRADERLKEEKNLWGFLEHEQITKHEKLLQEQREKVQALETMVFSANNEVCAVRKENTTSEHKEKS